jgi:hypothetical protein
MPLPDSSEVDAAVMAKLSGDPTLMGILTGGVYWDLASLGLTKFCIVSQLAHEDRYVLTASGLWERFTYLVKGVTQGTSGTEVKKASAQIHALLQGAVLVIPGYSTIDIARVERVRYTEVDETSDVRWQHRGGHYEVLVAPVHTVGESTALRHTA